MEIHGIQWNCSCPRNWHTSSPMESHGTPRINEIGALQVPCYLTEFPISEIGAVQILELLLSLKLAHSKLHGIPWFFKNPMQTFISSILWVLNFDRVPWNFMELKWQKLKFHANPWNLSRSNAPCNCIRLFPYFGVSWNSMGLLIFGKKYIEFHGIPSNFLEFHWIP